MITEVEYLAAKRIVEEYEHQEMVEAMNETMYCVPCGAFDQEDCICDVLDEDSCNFCCNDHGNHSIGCPYDIDPFDMLLTDGHD